MRPAAAPLPLLAASLLLPLLLPAAPAARGSLEPPAGNGSRPPAAPGPGNHSGARLSPVPAMLRDLSALKAAVIGACALTAALIGCLLLRVFRNSGQELSSKWDFPAWVHSLRGATVGAGVWNA
ncbi:membrane protein FAM174B isoform X2 [Poecile atricapillus]|uniref:membrane protein FAM174B isoform X2 n=1 Tax=Poecile atricapillus TaxID=48891 RepID=UPI00273A1795|nr:membrane protein FAM174B isoform X2 [Poecile atricapillus]